MVGVADQLCCIFAIATDAHSYNLHTQVQSVALQSAIERERETRMADSSEMNLSLYLSLSLYVHTVYTSVSVSRSHTLTVPSSELDITHDLVT